MAALVTKPIVRTSAALTPTFSAATVTVGDTIVPSDRTFLVVRTTSTGCTVTITPSGTVGYTDVAKPAVSVTLTSTQEKWIGPINTDLAGANGLATAICSVVTGVTVGAFSV